MSARCGSLRSWSRCLERHLAITEVTQKTADVVIIGGGIIGCAVAYYLSKAGLKVTLLERDGVAGGTTGNCMGHLTVEPGPEFSYHLSKASVDLWDRIAAEVQGFEYRKTGAIWLAEDAADMDLVRGEYERYRAQGDAVELLDGAQLLEMEPGLAPDLPGGMFYPADAVVMPMFAASALLRSAIGRGASVEPFTPVTGLRLGAGNKVEGVKTPDAVISTGCVVNACGIWSPDLTELIGLGRAPIHPRRGDLAITMHRTTPIRRQVLEVAYAVVGHGAAKVDPTDGKDPGARAVTVQPQSHGSCLIGSTRQFTDRRVVNRELLRQSMERAARYIPGLRDVPVVRTWSGLRPYVADKKPIIGPVAEVPGFYMASGHEGMGITLAPITGLLVTESITGKDSTLPTEPMALSRFYPEMEKSRG